MNLKEFFEKVVSVLQKEDLRFALAGGLVASIYREQERLTKDLDFLLLAQGDSLEIARGITEKMGLEAHVIRKADLEGGPLFAVRKKSTTPYMVLGRRKNAIGLDFILPAMPGFDSAMERAQENLIDFGFGKIPCLTVEDIILAKFYSYQNDLTRFNDLDDLKSIFAAQPDLEIDYLCEQMKRRNLTIPVPLKKLVPKTLVLLSKRKK